MAVPNSFICPITYEVMENPAVAADGQTYERDAIENWVQSHNTSPLTNAMLPHTGLIPNIALRKAIEEWRELQPMALDPDRLVLGQPEEIIGEGSFGQVIAAVLRTA